MVSALVFQTGNFGSSPNTYSLLTYGVMVSITDFDSVGLSSNLNRSSNSRLTQLEECLFYMEKVIGSSPISTTNVVIAPKYDFGKHPTVTSDWQCDY